MPPIIGRVRTVGRIFEQGTGPNRLLRVALTLVYAVIALVSDLRHLLFVYPFGVDLEIPLRAAERWRSGSEPYLASAFAAPPGEPTSSKNSTLAL